MRRPQSPSPRRRGRTGADPDVRRVPVAALPANLLAGAAAAPVVVWGLTAGLVAGVAGPDVARLLHVPTALLVGWVAAVARWTGRLPSASWARATPWCSRSPWSCWRGPVGRAGRVGRVGRLAAVAAVVMVATALHPPGLRRTGRGRRRARSGATLHLERAVVVDGTVSPPRLLEGRVAGASPASTSWSPPGRRRGRRRGRGRPPPAIRAGPRAGATRPPGPGRGGGGGAARRRDVGGRAGARRAPRPRRPRPPGRRGGPALRTRVGIAPGPRARAGGRVSPR
ncbi:MAG: hypothetical protein U5R31_00385 [Acidimicrobiia bacterium]|nr:hypothetical protein [Acidimicrobiia bacterium]